MQFDYFKWFCCCWSARGEAFREFRGWLQLYLSFVAGVKRFPRHAELHRFRLLQSFIQHAVPRREELPLRGFELDDEPFLGPYGRGGAYARHHIKFGVKYKRKCRPWCAWNERNRRPQHTHGPTDLLPRSLKSFFFCFWAGRFRKWNFTLATLLYQRWLVFGLLHFLFLPLIMQIFVKTFIRYLFYRNFL